ncbi:exostosin-like glycosyltransferase [Chloropicon primus]|uniref:Exostosin-like glycosyltransferase n=1 Tax=Chloropicon primus TaxID=1764295 RepID=A0A5B8MES3_9CHLO|nr:exostosin-like glycosyltransferase [Chloropicon primus]UPQ98265.1 exostosin-like glycosyltransferase [Chloropicon primus]|eukprot:QDZ19056.1 exostosin-like glycosyltransferase [Chloropicon primus]
MFMVLLKYVPANRRLPALALFFLGIFVVSLFLVDLDSAEEVGKGLEHAQGRGSWGSGLGAHREAGEADAAPASGIQITHGKISTGYNYKMFVYEEDIPRELYGSFKHDLHCQSEYSGVEALFPAILKRLDVYTPFSDTADYYVVPVMTECFLNKKLLMGKDFNWAVKDLNSLFESTLDEIQSSYPHWSRTEGRDHIFVFPSERGPSLLNAANMQRISKSIFLTGLTSYRPTVFEPWKDITVPAFNRPENGSDSDGSVQGDTSKENRDIFVHFRGAVPGLEDKQPSGLTHELQMALEEYGLDKEYVFKDLDEDCPDLACVRREMKRSTFCLCPGGDFEGWSLRLYKAISAGCIPVILADQAELPFAQLLDYSKFSVKILEREVDRVPMLLNEMGPTKIKNKQAELRKAKEKLSWDYTIRDAKGNPMWKGASALDSLLKVLQLKLRFMRNSPYHFWVKEENAVTE